MLLDVQKKKKNSFIKTLREKLEIIEKNGENFCG